MRFPILAGFLALLAGPALGQALSACDQLAGYTMVPRAPGLPGTAEITRPDRAIAACEDARRHEADPFLAFLLARAIEAADPDDPRLPDLIADGARASAPFAASRLGLLYAQGHGGLPLDPARARALAAESCAADPDPRAQAGCNNLAAAMVEPTEQAEAARLLERTCDAGFGLACTNLADRIEGGTAPGARPQDPLALRLRACDLRDAYACVLVGYARATAEPPDTPAAVDLYARACDLGEPQGCHALGQMLRGGPDTGGDWQRSQDSLGQACEGGIDAACYEHAVGLAYGQEGAGTDVADADLARALDTFGRLCAAGLAEACMDLGFLAAEGRGGAADPARGAELSARACGLGSALGCNNLGVHFALTGAPALAARYYERGCAQGAGLACANLADMRANGELGPPDSEGAADLYRKACDRGDAGSCDRNP